MSITSGGKTISSYAEYENNGNTLKSTTDAAGKVTLYGYDADTNVLEWVQYPEDTEATRTEYDYDNMYRLASAAVTTDTGLNLSAEYTYADDLLTAITTASTTYSFTYGDFALRSAVSIGERTLAEYTYTSRTNYLASLDYGNYDKVQYTYDQQGRVTQQTYEDGDTVTYRYDNNGALATVTDSATGIKTTYYYDFTDRLMKYVESDGTNTHSVGYEYDTINNLTKLVETINGVAHETSYTYDLDNRVTSITNRTIANGTTSGESTTRTYEYDGHSRVNRQVTKHGEDTVLTTDYVYRELTDTSATTGQIASLGIDSAGYDVTYSYTYDDNGNILSVSDGTHTTSYGYDSAGQLIRENNQAANKTLVWIYDRAGNIQARAEYAYTTASLEGVTPTDTVNYTYGDENWGDLLTAYDGQTITYDEIGNPLTNGTWTYTWEHGRELASMTNSLWSWSFEYNADGLRTSRTSGSTSYKYVYNGGKLVQMTKGNATLYFTYDASGTPMTVTYNGEVYYYVTNLQGDVVELLDSDGTNVGMYRYDAWGKLLDSNGSTTLVDLNPIRYRGYIYDHETGLYYLQSRYYDPEIGRFINADALVSTGQGILGNNMFAYCGNNPVMLLDPSGTIPFYDDPLQKVIEDFLKWYQETDEDETDENDKLTFSAKSKRTIKAFVRNLEFSAGLGVGLGKELVVFDMGATVCANYDILAVQYCDDEWKAGQVIAMSASTSITQALELGAGLNIFRAFDGSVDATSWIIHNDKKESWTLFSISYYDWFLGGNAELGFDLNTFLYDINMIWEE